jgi:hypothetical protein
MLTPHIVQKKRRLCIFPKKRTKVDLWASSRGDLVVAGYRALEPLVIDIVATGETVTEIHVLFDGVGIREAVAAAAWRAAVLAALLVAFVVAVSLWVVLLVAVARLVAVVVAMSRLLVMGDVGSHSKRAAARASIAGPTKSFLSKDRDSEAHLSQITGKVLLLSRLPKSAR